MPKIALEEQLFHNPSWRAAPPAQIPRVSSVLPMWKPVIWLSAQLAPKGVAASICMGTVSTT